MYLNQNVFYSIFNMYFNTNHRVPEYKFGI